MEGSYFIDKSWDEAFGADGIACAKEALDKALEGREFVKTLTQTRMPLTDFLFPAITKGVRLH